MLARTPLCRAAGSRAVAAVLRPILACSVPARALSTKMEVSADPQVMVTATGVHQRGALRDLTAALLDQGVSIAGSRKVMLNDSFAVLLSVWVPPGNPGYPAKTPEALVKVIEAETGPALGFSVTARLIDSVARAPEAPVRRHLRLSCPQKPGIIKAISELLKVCTAARPHHHKSAGRRVQHIPYSTVAAHQDACYTLSGHTYHTQYCPHS